MRKAAGPAAAADEEASEKTQLPEADVHALQDELVNDAQDCVRKGCAAEEGKQVDSEIAGVEAEKKELLDTAVKAWEKDFCGAAVPEAASTALRDKLTNDGEWMVADASARLWGEALEKTWPIEAAVTALQNQLTEDWREDVQHESGKALGEAEMTELLEAAVEAWQVYLECEIFPKAKRRVLF